MPRRKKTNSWQRILLSWPFLAFLTLVVVFAGIRTWDMLQTERGSSEAVQRLEADRQQLLTRKSTIADAASDVSTERGLEEEIRQKFSVAREGERVIVLVDADTQAPTPEPEELGWFSRLVSWIWPF